MEDFTNYQGTEEIVRLNIQIRITDLMNIIMREILPDATGFMIFQATLPANRVIAALKEIK
jgi:ABC-type dipeptide/oligopeptide/nickel transport system permease subunit